MGKRKIIIKQSVANSIASVSWYIESQGMLATAEKFSDDVYDFFIRIADDNRRFGVCRDRLRAAMGYKCITYKKKYTVVMIETET